MSNRVLTKAEILGGHDTVELVEIPALGGTVPLRRLTSTQMAEVEALKVKGMTIPMSSMAAAGGKLGDIAGDLDVSNITLNEAEAKALAVSYALALDEPLTVAEVQVMSGGVVDLLFDVIEHMSTVKPGDTESIASFLEQRGGAGDRGAAPDGLSAVADAG